MTDRIIETIERPDGRKRVYIVQRADGIYSFRIQEPEDASYLGPGTFVWPDGFLQEAGWWPPGPYLGFYDSAETAKWEALCKVEWLAAVSKPN
jgi:hypothetical protein